MQLIFDTETETCIDKKMAFIDKESINEKFNADNIIEKLSNSISNGNGNKENIEKVDNIVADKSTENSDIDSTKKSEVNGQNELSVDEEKNTAIVDTASSQTVQSESIEKNTDKKEDEECAESATDIDNTVDQSSNIDDANIHTDNDLQSDLEHEEIANGNLIDNQVGENSCSEHKNGENSNNEESDSLNNVGSSEKDSDDHKTEMDTEPDVSTVENQDEILENSTEEYEKKNEDVALQSNQSDEETVSFFFNKTKSDVPIAGDTIAIENGKISSNEDVINDNQLDKENISEQEKPSSLKDDDAKTGAKDISLSKDTEANSEIMEIDLIKEGASEIPSECKEKDCESPVEIENQVDEVSNKSSNIPSLQEDQTGNEKPSNLVETEFKPETRPDNQNSTSEPKKSFTKCKLSLDILSDDEDTLSAGENCNENSIESNKQCINIEDDDDDIMLIDDENSTKPDDTPKGSHENKEKVKIENKDDTIFEDKKEESLNNTSTIDKDIPMDEIKTDIKKNDTDLVDKEENKQKITSPKPLLPTNFVSTCKKNLADMTRSDLEEFCILKIVESVVDRGNLGEIKSQLKKMSQNIEEHKNKTKMLTKQNHALQVVLKSVQEELKKNSNAPIVPLKISRSVGIQVLMSEKNKNKKTNITNSSVVTTVNNATTPSPINKPIRGLPPQIIRSPKPPQQNIPVPRLVPASSAVKSNTPATNQIPTTNNKTIITAPPAAKKSPAQRPEKRPLVKIPNDTVDLTDDEPPPKVTSRPNNQSVRLVPPQNLMAPQRPQLGTLINSPRKVYIPISGGQGQNVRPGQTFMLRTINPQNVRQRGPAPIQKETSYRKVSLHPAPLPEGAKQCQPPNWKLIPPAPEITLSKVDNGIVISWNLDSYHEDNYENIASYQIYAYQETAAPPSTSLWKKIGDVKALPLPMACTLTQFVSGYKYYFAVRAVDIRSRLGPFSLPSNIMLVNK
ncbi:activating transcription factor 7-interacting protein 1 [Colias croceus]|uniref:activating transcription factor 7-interacting protein 1 n=1 Tax=Colias crocea TaxID=72248 RepID=UPI001E27B515|nr:activating transcription factor 7-interacting protein 1 [Colias croceus]XP_045495885.1 activating transcription factor 7-interacting protein 1 [Colias croceus]